MSVPEQVLALIPARGGSKSVPRKNLKTLGGKPLIAHSIEHALASRQITRTIVTTDDKEIAEVARAHGAEVPFLRPAEYAQDLSTDFECVRHALDWLKQRESYVPMLVVQLRPTTPRRNPRTIDRAIDTMLRRDDVDSLRAVTKACFTPYKMWHIDQDGLLRPVLRHETFAEPYNMPRQVLPETFQQDGFIDITRPRTVFEQGSITGSRILPFFIEDESIDIDELSDLAAAERAFRR